jgi:CheY-like chemotaxis protein
MGELIGQIKTKKILLDTALNGQLAVDQVIETWRGGNAYDVIFLDLNMPILDGFQVSLSINYKVI